jgi:hypothetical protein
VCFDTISGTNNYCVGDLPVREQSNRVTVYDNNLNVVNENQYMIDYIDGRIVTDGTCSPAYVDYYWHYVSLVDEWSVLEAASPPVVVIDMNATDKIGYQLGGGKKIIRKVNIHVFASDTAERNDLMETIYDGLYEKSCLLHSFPNGTPLDYDGTFYGRRNNPNKDETLFDRSVVNGVSKLAFENVSARTVNLPALMSRGTNEIMLSDLNAYRARVSFNLVSYTSY